MKNFASGAYSSKAKAYYAGNNDFTFTLRNIGFTLTKNDRLFPDVAQTAGPDWTNLANYTDNLYASARTEKRPRSRLPMM